MCIAIVSEPNVELPSEEILKHCFDSNSDGGGFVHYVAEEQLWHGYKGFMTWDEWWTAFDSMQFKAEDCVAMHFRIGTSGRAPDKRGIYGGEAAKHCTHPFPISKDKETLDLLSFKSEGCVVHNGVVGKGHGIYSDTQQAIWEHIAVLWPYAEEDDDVYRLLKELLDCGPRYAGSRWFIGSGSNYYLLGGWVEDKDTKIMYSHDGYKPVVYDGNRTGWEDHWPPRTQMPVSSTPFRHTLESSVTLKRPAHSFCSGGNWDWDKYNVMFPVDYFEKDDDDRGSVRQGTDTATNSQSDTGPVRSENERPIWDATGQEIVGLVSPDGDVIWDEILSPGEVHDFPTSTGANAVTVYDIHCVDCGAVLSSEQVNDGLCPWCESYVGEPKSQDRIECPHCKEQNYLRDSTFDGAGDTECCRCGAVFLSTIMGMDSIVMWNEDTKFRHDAMIKKVMGMDESSDDDDEAKEGTYAG